MYDLTDPYLKTTRAKEHLESLRCELRVFCESSPCELTSEDDLKNQRHRLRVKIKDAPHRLSLILGDFLSCLRSSLDQLVWCLAKTPGSYPERTQFPIISKDNSQTRKTFNSQTNGISGSARAMIESLQPYKAGDAEAIKSHHLWVLHKLCNVDKHIRIPAYGADLRWKLPKEIFHSASFEDADELGRGVLSIPLRLKKYMVPVPAPSFSVLFGDAFYGIECDIENLQRIYDFVADDVIPRFARLS